MNKYYYKLQVPSGYYESNSLIGLFLQILKHRSFHLFKHQKLKRLLAKAFPGKKIVITDNKDGSQTISIT